MTMSVDNNLSDAEVNDTNMQLDDPVAHQSAPKPIISSIRIHVPLSQDETENNVFDYSELRRLHIERFSSKASTEVAAHTTSVDLMEVAETDEEDDQPIIRHQRNRMKNKKKKKQVAVDEDEYDLDDIFIDDSEMFMEEFQEHLPPPRWHYGFFAWKGSVESFLEQKAKQKKKGGNAATGKKKTNTGASTAVIVGQVPKPTDSVNSLATPANPLSLSTPASVNNSPQKKSTKSKNTTATSKQASSTSAPASKATPVKATAQSSTSSTASAESKKVEMVPLSPPVASHMKRLKEAAAKESFAVKKNFPADLKPILKEAANAALDIFEHDANFYAHVTSILPYNTFTMKKLIANLVHPDKILEYRATSTGLIGKLRVLVQDLVKSQGLLNVPATPVSSSNNPPSTMNTTKADPSQPVVKEDPANPKPKFKFNEECRNLLWNILCLEWEAAKLENELNHYNKKDDAHVHQEQAVRRAAYMRMIEVWPNGLMDAPTLSKEFSLIRHKMKKKKRTSLEPTPSGLIIRPDPFKPASYGQGTSTSNNSEGASVQSTPKKSSTHAPSSSQKSKIQRSVSSTSVVSNTTVSISSPDPSPPKEVVLKKRKQPPTPTTATDSPGGSASNASQTNPNEKKTKLDPN